MVYRSINWQLTGILTKGLLRCFKLKLSYQTTVDCISARSLILTKRRSRGLSILKYGGFFGSVLVARKSFKHYESALHTYSGYFRAKYLVCCSCVQIAIPWYQREWGDIILYPISNIQPKSIFNVQLKWIVQWYKLTASLTIDCRP